jgi:tetratricopeptide (TPR) repeat protein
MEFNQDNKIVQLCSTGMELEGQGKLEEAGKRFEEAWNQAATDFEKFTAAHYMARHQKSISDKLKWDKEALRFALNIEGDNIKESLPSLYLNIGKCYEDLNDFENAKNNYDAAFSFSTYLPDTGYGNMIKGGIAKAVERILGRDKL